jgi:hypothetical protein
LLLSHTQTLISINNCTILFSILHNTNMFEHTEHEETATINTILTTRTATIINRILNERFDGIRNYLRTPELSNRIRKIPDYRHKNEKNEKNKHLILLYCFCVPDHLAHMLVPLDLFVRVKLKCKIKIFTQMFISSSAFNWISWIHITFSVTPLVNIFLK